MNWTEVDPANTRTIPKCAGLYAVYVDGRVYYIGRSYCLKYRIAQHQLLQAIVTGNWKGTAFKELRLKIRRADATEIEGIERRLIVRIRPPLNVTYLPGHRLPREVPQPDAIPASPKDAPAKLVRACDSDALALAVSMKAAGCKLAYMAAVLGVSMAYVSRMRAGKRPIPDKLVQTICNATGSNLLKQVRDLNAVLERDEVAELAEMLRGAA